MRIIILFALTSITLGACASKNMEQPAVNTSNNSPTPKKDSVTYLALGDSYTIGESVPQQASFPYQLVHQLSNKQIKAAAPLIIARTGWTTADLQSAIARVALTQKFDFVTLLIGVNNQYQSRSIDEYRTQFKDLLGTAISFAGGNAKHVFVLSIPDWSVTPYAAHSGRDIKQIAAEIGQFNAVNLDESQKAGVNYTNITDISRTAATDPSLIATDGLHPSERMYELWVEELAPLIP